MQRHAPVVPRLTEPMGDSLIGTEVCRLTIPGDPTTKSRPRFGGKHAYTPQKTRAAEHLIGWTLKASGLQPDADHFVRVELVFRTKTRQRRDLDNLVKLVLDACNKIAWADDFQVVSLACEVHRAANDPAGIDLVVIRHSRYTRDCRTCGQAFRMVFSKRYRGGFCSRECYDHAQRLGRWVNCGECGKEIYRQRSRTERLTFCSKDCDSAYKRGRPRPPGKAA